MSAYTEAVERGTEGLEAVSTGICPGCEECAADLGITKEELSKAWESGDTSDEPHFSWSSCDICGSHLGGDRECWHAIRKEDGSLFHGDGACVDCIVYLANGDEPENWKR